MTPELCAKLLEALEKLLKSAVIGDRFSLVDTADLEALKAVIAEFKS